MSHIAPTLLCADLLDLGRQIDILESLDIKWFHVDVMDGHFVPNLAFGIDIVKSIRSRSTKPILLHMMLERPQDFIHTLSKCTDYCVFHLETSNNPFRIVEEIRNAGLKPGIAINPATPVENLKALLPHIHVVTLMAVEPGYSGQTFMNQTYERIAQLKALIRECSPEVLIEVDGGIDGPIGSRCLNEGADVLVGGAFSLFREEEDLNSNYQYFASFIEKSRIHERLKEG